MEVVVLFGSLISLFLMLYTIVKVARCAHYLAKIERHLAAQAAGPAAVATPSGPKSGLDHY
jgi:hypothetical protein